MLLRGLSRPGMNMTRSRTKTVPCPACGKKVVWSEQSKWRPFCSERCRTMDLGDWLTEKHRVPGEPAPPDHSEPEN